MKDETMNRYGPRLKNWILTSGLTALLSGAVATFGGYVLHEVQDSHDKSRELANDAVIKLREKRYEAFIAFASEDDGLLDACKLYINAVLKKKSLKKPAEDLNDQIKKQVRSVDKLKTLFAGSEIEKSILEYQRALLSFAASIGDFKDEGSASEWSANFETVFNKKSDLRTSLRKAIQENAS